MLRLWCKLHEKLVKSAATWRPPTGGGLALLGDSITESWRGTEFGRRVPRAHGVPRVLRETLGTRWPEPLVLGIAGDQTQHLLWRLQHGEAAASWTQAPEMLTVLLIGTNNLGAGQRPAEAAAGVLAVASWLLRHAAGPNPNPNPNPNPDPDPDPNPNPNPTQVIDRLGGVMYEYPFTLPPYYTAVIRCLGVLEGVALQVDLPYPSTPTCTRTRTRTPHPASHPAPLPPLPLLP